MISKTEKTEPCCASAVRPETVLFACSGAADVGEIADRVARRLEAGGTGSFSCLAAIAAGNEKLRRRAAQLPVMAIDGCPGDCVRKTLEAADVRVSYHLRLTDLGFQKGKSPATAKRVKAASTAAIQMIKKEN